MKNWFKIILPLMFLLLLCAQAAGEGEENILGVWQGSYLAAETGPDGNALTRETTIRIRSLNKDTGEFYGIMEYRIPGFRGNLYGSYYFKGQLNTLDSTYTLQGYRMLVDDGYYNHDSFTVYKGKFEGGQMRSETFDFVLTKTGAFEGVLDPSYFLGTWEGQHYGSVSGINVLRNSHLVIESVSETGAASGSFGIFRIEGAEHQITGRYRWYGYIDLTDGHIEFQGKDWIDFPDVPGTYTFQHYAGMVSGNVIQGNNGNGDFYYVRNDTTDVISYVDEHQVLHSENGSIYRIFSAQDWESARDWCEALGGHLAVITTDRENDYLTGFTKMLGYERA